MRRGCILAGFALALLGRGAAAQTRDAAAAEAVFEDAKRLADEGHFAEACPKFAESNRLDPGVGTQLYLGACYERVGKIASAWAAFREAREGAATQGRKDRVAKAEQRVAALEPRLPRLRIVVAADSAIAGLTIQRDELSVNEATWGTPIPVDPGTLVVRATAPGYEPWEQSVEAKEGELSTVEVPPLRPSTRHDASNPARSAGPASASHAPPSTEDSGSGQRVVAGVLFGVGGASVVAGAIFGVLASSHWSSAQEQCTGSSPLRCTSEGLDEIDATESTGLASTILFVIGGAAAAGGGVLWLTAPTGESTSAAVGVDLGGIHAAGSF